MEAMQDTKTALSERFESNESILLSKEDNRPSSEIHKR